ncbi:MAG TPA: PAS domain-containing sensor histidine kinase [Polyangiaceae bacterium]|jgi:PAS domain S-box-containing protein|nr:PAS domain-containing sensor histidine kinase [Polyangiaceae bacterium]
MSILIVSPDGDAARSLSSALGRTGHPSHWIENIDEAREHAGNDAPLVLVVDQAVERFRELIDDVSTATPWVRVYEMAETNADVVSGHSVLRKPFDAAELATLLGREQKLAEIDRRRHNVEEHAEELALLVEASFEAIIGLGPDGSIRSWNRGAQVIYGYEAAEVIGQSIAIVEPLPGAALGRLVVSESKPEPVEALRRTKDGRDVIVLLSVSPVARGRTFAFAETSLDITLRRRLERELEHEKRLAAIGRIAAAMAHEINNPLAVVRAANAYVAEVARASRDELLIETVDDVRLAVERIGGFVNHVCGFSRRDRPMLNDTSVRESVRMALRLAKPRAAERRVDITLEPGADLRLPHDAARVSQALLNLVSNAIDAAADGGCKVIVRLVADSQAVRLQVDDNGPGIPESMRARVFEPFTTTKPQGKGTGLGLAITRQIVEDHSGEVKVGPAPGGVGTRAEIVLPLVRKPSASQRPKAI